MSKSTKAAPATVLLEVSPRSAKLMIATVAPVRVQRVTASTLPEQTEDPVAAVRALLELQSLTTREVGVLFGRELFSLRTLELPSVDPKEIASMLELQLGKLTPYPRSEIRSAWATIGSFREGYTSVLLAIARKELIDGVLAVLKSKGLTPRWAGVSTEGLELWATAALTAPLVADGQLLVLLDIDFSSSDCAILSADGRLVFTHSLSIGYDQLSSDEQALVRLVGELIRLPRILLHEEIKGTIGRGVITGAGLHLERMVDQLSNQWGAPVQVHNVLETLVSAEVRERATLTHVSYTALAGLTGAARPPRIDLIPQETRVSQALHVRSQHLARLAGSVATILLLTAVLYLERIVILSYYRTQLQQQLTTVGRTAQQVLQRQHAIHTVRNWLDPTHSPLEIFRSIAAATNPDIVITQVSLEDQKPVTIRGKTETVANAFAFAQRLKQQGVFASIDVHPVLKPKGTNEMGAEFEMVCQFPS